MALNRRTRGVKVTKRGDFGSGTFDLTFEHKNVMLIKGTAGEVKVTVSKTSNSKMGCKSSQFFLVI